MATRGAVRILDLSAITVALVVALSASKTATSQYCRGPDDQSRSDLGSIRGLLQSDNPVFVAKRVQFGIQNVSASQVSLILDDAICARGSAVADSVSGDPPSGRAVYAFAVGNGHYVIDPYHFTLSEYGHALVFDTAWSFKGPFLVSGRLLPDTLP